MKSPLDYMFHAATAALLAGKPVMEEFERRPKKCAAVAKENTYSVQNPADVRSSEIINEYLSKHCPETGFLDEERGRTGNKDLLWIVDPIDGSANFAMRHSDFGISVALAHRGNVIASAIYLPAKNKLYFASKGGGTCLVDHLSVTGPHKWKPLHEWKDKERLFAGGRKVSVAPKERDRGKMMISTGFSHDAGLRRRAIEQIYSKHLTQVRDIVQPSSAVIGLTDVAEGTRHAYVHEGLKPWDVAAGVLLVEEAGGKVFNWDGTKWRLPLEDKWHPIVATNGEFPLDRRK